MEKEAKSKLYVGVDTHKHFHAVCVLDETGKTVCEQTYEASAVGYKSLEKDLRGLGEVVRVAIEGTSCYGRGLCEYLLNRNFDVYEALSPGKRPYSPDGKTDAIDALAAARLAFWDQCPGMPKTHSGHSEDLALLCSARDSAIKEMTSVGNAVQGLIVKAKDHLKDKLSTLKGEPLMKSILKMRKSASEPELLALKSLAKRWMMAKEQAQILEKAMADIVNTHFAPLASACCVGTLCAAELVAIAGDNPERFGSEAGFAKSLGVSPIPASSGNTHHMRLNRRGSRQGNKVIHRIAIVRLSNDKRTQDYVAKKMAEGKTKKDAIRCLKRFIAREIYGLLLQCSKTTYPLPDLKAMRKQCKLTQVQVAALLKTSYSKLSLLERGLIRDLDLEARYKELLFKQNKLRFGSLQI